MCIFILQSPTFIFRVYSHLGWIELYRSVRHINADLYLYRLRHGLAEHMPLKLTDASLATDKVNYEKWIKCNKIPLRLFQTLFLKVLWRLVVMKGSSKDLLNSVRNRFEV